MRWPGSEKSLSCGGPIVFEASFWASAGAPAAARPDRTKAAARRRRRIGGMDTKNPSRSCLYPPPRDESTAERRDLAAAGLGGAGNRGLKWEASQDASVGPKLPEQWRAAFVKFGTSESLADIFLNREIQF